LAALPRAGGRQQSNSENCVLIAVERAAGLNLAQASEARLIAALMRGIPLTQELHYQA